MAGGRPWVWHQDSAPAHKFKESRTWLQKECYDFVPFSHWPPPPPTWTNWTTSFGHTLRTSPTWPPITPKPAWSLYIRPGQNYGNTWKFQINLFLYGFLNAAIPWNTALCSSLLTVLEETGFSRLSLSSAVIFGAVNLPNNPRKNPTVSIRLLSLSSRVLLQWEFFSSFSNAVVTFVTVLLPTANKSAVFITLASAIRAPTFWPLLKSSRSAVLMNFD